MLNLEFDRLCQCFTNFVTNMSGGHQTPKLSRRDRKQSAQTIGKPLRKHTKIVRKSYRCNKARAFVRNLANSPVLASKNDAQGVLGRAPASKSRVRRAKVEHKTLEGRQKIDRQPRKSAKAPPKIAKAGRGTRRKTEASVSKSEIIR